jgi:hypothetical protein
MPRGARENENQSRGIRKEDKSYAILRISS